MPLDQEFRLKYTGSYDIDPPSFRISVRNWFNVGFCAKNDQYVRVSRLNLLQRTDMSLTWEWSLFVEDYEAL